MASHPDVQHFVKTSLYHQYLFKMFNKPQYCVRTMVFLRIILIETWTYLSYQVWYALLPCNKLPIMRYNNINIVGCFFKVLCNLSVVLFGLVRGGAGIRTGLFWFICGAGFIFIRWGIAFLLVWYKLRVKRLRKISLQVFRIIYEINVLVNIRVT